MKITTVGVDLAKNVFQVHGVDEAGEVVVRKTLRRRQMTSFFSKLEPCLIGMEACGTSHHWARELSGLGHQVKLMPPAYVKAYVKRGKTDASDAEVRQAAADAGAAGFIERLPDGYATPLGRSGGKLSVGQKQRIAIARALVRNAPILILDEPTSAVDPETERQLVESLQEASRSRLVLVIAHRLTTIESADEILFVADGKIVERGSHSELASREGGAYWDFIQIQARGAT